MQLIIETLLASPVQPLETPAPCCPKITSYSTLADSLHTLRGFQAIKAIRTSAANDFWRTPSSLLRGWPSTPCVPATCFNPSLPPSIHFIVMVLQCVWKYSHSGWSCKSQQFQGLILLPLKLIEFRCRLLWKRDRASRDHFWCSLFTEKPTWIINPGDLDNIHNSQFRRVCHS